MEKRISLTDSKILPMNTKKIHCLVFLFCMGNTFVLLAQNDPSSNLLRFPLWFVMEEAPSIAPPLPSGENPYLPAIQNIKEITPFFVEGLVYGWSFSYTPSDQLRGVSEYFEMEPLFLISAEDERLRYTDPKLTQNATKLECWVEYDMTDRMVYERQKWESASYPRIHGQGADSVFNGTDGIKKACELALKNAVRSYMSSLIKNKPKEIEGTVLLTDLPRYYIDGGKYTTDLDFFLFVSKIVEYTQF